MPGNSKQVLTETCSSPTPKVGNACRSGRQLRNRWASMRSLRRLKLFFFKLEIVWDSIKHKSSNIGTDETNLHTNSE